MVVLSGDDFHTYFSQVRKLQEMRVSAILARHDSETDFANHLTSAAMRMMGECFSSSRTDFRVPALRASRQFLLDVFGPGGIFADVLIDEITFKPCEILWAPLLHLMAENPNSVPALRKPLMEFLGRIQLVSEAEDPNPELRRLQLNMQLISTRLGHVDHEAVLTESRRSVLLYMRGFQVLPLLLPDGRLQRLVSWGQPMTQVALKVEDATINSRLASTDFGRVRVLLSKIYATASQSFQPVPDELKTQLEETLIRELINAYIRWPRARDTYGELLVGEVATCRQALSLEQWIVVLDITGAGKASENALVALEAFSPTETLEAIRNAYEPAQRSRMIRLCGIEAHVPALEMIRWDAKAFSQDLGM